MRTKDVVVLSQVLLRLHPLCKSWPYLLLNLINVNLPTRHLYSVMTNNRPFFILSSANDHSYLQESKESSSYCSLDEPKTQTFMEEKMAETRYEVKAGWLVQLLNLFLSCLETVLSCLIIVLSCLILVKLCS